MSRRLLQTGIGSLLSPAGRRARLVVFCYHQVLDAEDPLRPGEPTEAEFQDDVQLIDSVFKVLTFGEAVRKLVSGTLPDRAACITFDDGYENNVSLAAPILVKSGVPATFFVAGGAVDQGVMWNDLVIEAVAHTGSGLKLDSGLEFGHDVDLSTSKEQIVPSLIKRLKYMQQQERWDASVTIYRQNVGTDLPRLMMTREMVNELATRGFEIGGHTISHPILRELDDARAAGEIAGCRQWIEQVTGSVPESFAYPNGKSGTDFDGRHLKMVMDEGFLAAASTDWAVATSETNRYSIPRVGPWWRQGRRFESGQLRAYLRSYL